MTSVSAMYARKQIENADNIKDKAQLYNIVGLTPQSAKDPAVMVAMSDYHCLMETIAKSEWPRLQFHMKTCKSMRCDEFGLFGLAFKTAPTLRHGFQSIWRYIQLHNRVSVFSAEEKNGRYCWSMAAPPISRLGSFLSNEAAMATTLNLCRETTCQSLQPVHVQFMHEREGCIEPLVEHFGCVPEFGADADAMYFSLDQVARPCLIGDPALWNYMTGHLDQALAEEQNPQTPFEAQVIEEIVKLLSSGVPQLCDVSKVLGLGIRTFQRRLQEQGKTFQTLVDEARQQLAEQLVLTSSYTFTEIAFLTGFSEQSAFSRAFKRWSGQSPKAYRLAFQASTAQDAVAQ